jgi:hypothetical protein
MQPHDECLVMGDTRLGPLPESESIVSEFDERFRYIPVPPTFCSFGHNEINAGLDLARGAYIIGNDDDDIGTPTALEDIRTTIAVQPHPRPMLFRFMAHWRDLVWYQEGVLVEGGIGGHCLVQPNVPGKVARLTPRYCGDFDWVVRAVELYGGDVAWVDRCIAWARPTAKELARMIPEMVAV